MADGTLADPIVVPARSGRGFRLPAGETIAVIDLEGGQAVDLFAFVADAPDEYLSASHTRVARERLFPAVGQAFVTNRRRPILTLVEDTSPGVHDMWVAACDRTRYELLGVSEHASCEDNLERALREHGVEMGVVPQPVNLFTNIPADTDGALTYLPALTRPGDRVLLLADLDAIVVVSACPQDLTPINHGRPTSVGVALLTHQPQGSIE